MSSVKLAHFAMYIFHTYALEQGWCSGVARFVSLKKNEAA